MRVEDDRSKEKVGFGRSRQSKDRRKDKMAGNSRDLETRGTEKERRGRKRRCRRSETAAEKSGESPHITLWKSEREGRCQWSRNSR